MFNSDIEFILILNPYSIGLTRTCPHCHQLLPQVSVENLLDLVGYHKVENQITEIRSNLDEAVDEVKKLAALKRYNSTHSVFGTR